MVELAHAATGLKPKKNLKSLTPQKQPQPPAAEHDL
jgi:hypothetical protein